jgi:two-component system response regulator MtrA
MHELTARVRARLRATTSTAANQASLSEIRFGDVTIDPLKRTISKGTKKVEVTTLEFNLLLLLASNPGKPVSREELLQRIWQVDNKSYQANVSQVIRRIRKKIEDDPDNPQILLTVRGFGYAFCEQP